MSLTEDELPRVRVMLALERMPRRLQSDVLDDDALVSECDLQLDRSIRLSDVATVDRGSLFAAFRRAKAAKVPLTVIGKDKRQLEATASFDEDGSGILELGQQRWRFEHAALLAHDASGRRKYLREKLSGYTLSPEFYAEAEERLGAPEFGDEDFLWFMMLLDSTPESFASTLAEKVNKTDINRLDLLPSDDRHWEHLLAAPSDAAALTQYLAQQRAQSWDRWLAADPIHAMQTLSLGFAVPALIPQDLLRQLDAKTLQSMVESVAGYNDHFALIGAFEICAANLDRDPGFVRNGERLLDRLFATVADLETACSVFAATFVIATAHLAQHDVFQTRSVFWRRLAAASHASLAARAVGLQGVDGSRLLSWGLTVSEPTYMVSVFADFPDEPSWLPEWADPKVLVADSVGRAASALQRINPELKPATWQQKLDRTLDWIKEHGLVPHSMFPAILEGERRQQSVAIDEFGKLSDEIHSMIAAPTPQRLLALLPAMRTFGMPNGAHGAIVQAVEALQASPMSPDSPEFHFLMEGCAYLAARNYLQALADAVAAICLESAPTITKHGSMIQLLFHLIACSAADQDAQRRTEVLAQRLERFAFSLPFNAEMDQCRKGLTALAAVNPRLAPHLGRAIAAARLLEAA